MTDPDTSRGRKRLILLKRIVLWVGIACCLQFFVFGAIGVARGYSLQSIAPLWVMLVGVILVMPFSRKHGWVSLLSSGCLIVYALTSLSKGMYRDKGEEHYEDGQFAEAITEYRKELDTWYLRASYNYEEGPSLLGIAKSQSQLEQFGEARETYAEMTSKLRGYYKKRAEEELKDLDLNLKQVAALEKELAAQEDDQEKAAILFDLALVYRGLNCTGKAVEQYERIRSLEIPEVFQKQARRFAGKLQ